jgi:hypothetical protein
MSKPDILIVGGHAFSWRPPQSAWGVISIPFLTNSATGSAWSLSDLTNAGFNIGFESQN